MSSTVAGELAKKKARLAELRRAREARLFAGSTPASASAAAQSVEQILAAVGIAPGELPRAGVELGGAVPVSAPAAVPAPAAPEPPAALPDAVGGSEKRSVASRCAGTLSISDAIVLDIPGRRAVDVYEKVTQTDTLAEGDEAAEIDGVNESSVANAETGVDEKEGNGGVARESSAEDQQPPVVEVMSDAEWAAIQRSEDFGDFFWKSTKVMERALGLQEVYDILKDYSVDKADNVDKEERSKILRRTGARVFFAPQRCADRPVTCLEWSPHHPELVIAAYYQSPSARLAGAGSTDEGDGLVCVWNTRSGQCEQPEYVLSCEAVVTALCAHPYSPCCYVGGTCVGQIVVWDLRASTRPIARSPLSCNCHIHPIVGVEIIGSQHAHSLVSLSRDGTMCTWDLSKMSEPLEQVALRPAVGGMAGGDSAHLLPSSADYSVSATALASCAGDVNLFLVGSEDGLVHCGSRKGAALSADGVARRGAGGAGGAHLGRQIAVHNAPVTSVHMHPPGDAGKPCLSHIAASSSMDFTCPISIWDSKSGRSILSLQGTSADTVLDVRWSPQHPGMLASVDAAGLLQLWDLGSSPDAPLEEVLVTGASEDREEDALLEGGGALVARSLNCVGWSADSRCIACGDSIGRVHVIPLGVEALEHLAPAWDAGAFLSSVANEDVSLD